MDFPENDRHINKGERQKYHAAGTHPPIISKEQFERVQEEKLRHSNIH